MSGRILFVCTGNTCRSPMAEGIARHLLANGLLGEQCDWQVRSAGTMAPMGGSPTPEAVRAVHRLGADISGHRASPVDADSINWATIIYGMTRSHMEIVRQMDPTSSDRLYALDPNGDIADPIGQSQAVYDHTADQLQRLIRQRLKELTPCES